MKKTIVLVSLFLIISSAAYCATTEEMMRASLAKGYLTVKEANKKDAVDDFKDAFKYAEKIGHWSGMLDAGEGLLVLGEDDEAAECFEEAENVIKKQKDWRGAIALGYIHFSMPKYAMDEGDVLRAFKNAATYAVEQGDWRGLLEVAKGYIKFGARERLLAVLDSAYEIVQKSKSIEGLKEIAGYYKDAGQVDKSQGAIRLIDEFDDIDDIYEEMASMPQGWTIVK